MAKAYISLFSFLLCALTKENCHPRCAGFAIMGLELDFFQCNSLALVSVGKDEEFRKSFVEMCLKESWSKIIDLKIWV